MGTPKEVIAQRKEREKAQRLESIIEAAKRIFITKGYLGATMDEIALDVEISKPTLYQYFKSKDDLYFSLLIPFIEELIRHQGRIEKKLIDGTYTSGIVLLRNMFQGFYRTYQSDPGLFAIFQMIQQTGIIWDYSDTMRKHFAEALRRHADILRRILDIAMEQKLLQKMDSYSLSCILWGLFTGIVQIETLKSKEKDGSLDFLKPNLDMAIDLISTSLVKHSVANGRTAKRRSTKTSSKGPTHIRC